MTLFLHEWRQNSKLLIIWTAVIASMTFVFMLIFPQMAGQVDEITELFANMGSFSTAFGMDKINVATPLGFYGVEVGAVISIGGGMLAALLGGNMLCKEEGLHTSELLFTMPHKRSNLVLWKGLAMLSMIVAFNVVCTLAGIGAFACIEEEILWKEFGLYHLALTFMQLEIGMICFCISAFLQRPSLGVSIGVSMLFYFLQLFANISDKVEWLKYITPYCYADASNIFPTASVEWGLVILGFLYAVVAVTIGICYYEKKDLRA